MSKTQDLENQLAQSSAQSQENNRHFLMAIAASAIGFSFTQLKIEAMHHNHLLLALSIALWAASFYFGNKTLEWMAGFKLRNAKYLQELRKNPQYQTAIEQKINKIEQRDNMKISTYSSLQNHLLISGAISYSLYYMFQIISASP